jgi:hypothetical protein
MKSILLQEKQKRQKEKISIMAYQFYPKRSGALGDRIYK